MQACGQNFQDTVVGPGNNGQTHRDAAPAIRASNNAPAPRLLAAMTAAMRSAAAHAAAADAAAAASSLSFASSSSVSLTDDGFDGPPCGSSVHVPSTSTFAQGDSLRPCSRAVSCVHELGRLAMRPKAGAKGAEGQRQQAFGAGQPSPCQVRKNHRWLNFLHSGGLLCSCASLKERACDDRPEEARALLERRPVALQQAMDISVDCATGCVK